MLQIIAARCGFLKLDAYLEPYTDGAMLATEALQCALATAFNACFSPTGLILAIISSFVIK